MKKTLRFLLGAAMLGCAATVAQAQVADCPSVAVAVKKAVEADAAKVLEVVAGQVAANDGCACEVVKAAIIATSADAELVGKIVEVAVTAAPEQMRLIGQCAVAVAPDALAAVQAVLSKLDPGAGESGYSGKGAKVVMEKSPIQEVATIPNPLDFPGFGPDGRSTPLVIPIPPVIIVPDATPAGFIFNGEFSNAR